MSTAALPQPGSEPALWSIEFPLRRCYNNSHGYTQEGKPRGHSIQLVATKNNRHRWHVRVVLEYGVGNIPGLPARKKALVDLCSAIDFDSLSLLHDTVTAVYISTKNTNSTATKLVYRQLLKDHPFAGVDGFWVDICEDPARYQYPAYIGGASTRQIELSKVKPITQISQAVFTAQIDSEGQTYILKQVERLIYLPQDSQALEQELRVLEKVGGRRYIIRLVAAIISKNPYATDSLKEAPQVLRGLLLEHHPGGTLAEALDSKTADAPWQQWGTQLCTAVATLHQHDITHMDVKPSNIVIDKDRNLVLIDVGGAGGVTYGWLSPKMENLLEPLSASLQGRKENDAWAVGKVLSKMAEVAETQGQEAELLRRAAAEAMRSEASLTAGLSKLLSG